ncbi:MAG: hypothetical protein GVY24_03365 [Planctomycetes bacterium]|nr:hypothetical protein [Planctomycetota bacterium]
MCSGTSGIAAHRRIVGPGCQLDLAEDGFDGAAEADPVFDQGLEPLARPALGRAARARMEDERALGVRARRCVDRRDLDALPGERVNVPVDHVTRPIVGRAGVAECDRGVGRQAPDVVRPRVIARADEADDGRGPGQAQAPGIGQRLGLRDEQAPRVGRLTVDGVDPVDEPGSEACPAHRRDQADRTATRCDQPAQRRPDQHAVAERAVMKNQRRHDREITTEAAEGHRRGRDAAS